ncbi:hypothetical protein ACLB1E_34240 [Escherichia coli]
MTSCTGRVYLSGEDAVDNINKAISIYGKATKNTLKFVKAAKIRRAHWRIRRLRESVGPQQPADDTTDNTPVPDQLNDESNTETLDTPPFRTAPAPKDS